ncbi:2Fe-2S iron-sulfur cluster-binding protein [Brevibacillus ginsengisoli]|uniref:2Fe-2S iron-sulfur cluster-binding protein n=1 Tax=Brevibacillus ginsengisoli TaxID=363854 RepID=UPI003CE7505C
MNQLTLHTRKGTLQIGLQLDRTIVKLAKEHKISWGYACERGNCAQCRTKVLKGSELLNEVTPEEKRRLRKTELSEGYRLGCQIQIKHLGEIELAHTPY